MDGWIHCICISQPADLTPSPRKGDLILIMSGDKNKVLTQLGSLRIEIAEKQRELASYTAQVIYCSSILSSRGVFVGVDKLATIHIL